MRIIVADLIERAAGHLDRATAPQADADASARHALLSIASSQLASVAIAAQQAAQGGPDCTAEHTLGQRCDRCGK